MPLWGQWEPLLPSVKANPGKISVEFQKQKTLSSNHFPTPSRDEEPLTVETPKATVDRICSFNLARPDSWHWTVRYAEKPTNFEFNLQPPQEKTNKQVQ